MELKPDRLIVLAVEAALNAPERTGRGDVLIPWYIITEIREELEARGIDWRDGVRKTLAARKAARAERIAIYRENKE